MSQASKSELRRNTAILTVLTGCYLYFPNIDKGLSQEFLLFYFGGVGIYFAGILLNTGPIINGQSLASNRSQGITFSIVIVVLVLTHIMWNVSLGIATAMTYLWTMNLYGYYTYFRSE